MRDGVDGQKGGWQPTQREVRRGFAVLTCQATTDGTRSTLGDVQRRQGRSSTNAQAGNESANIHDGQRSLGRRGSLEDDADDGEHAGADEHDAAAIAVGEPAGEEAGGEAPGLERGHNVLTHVVLCGGGAVGVVEALLEVGHVEDAANGASVPAEEHAAEAGGEDEGEDAPAVDFVRVGAHGVVAHDGAQDLGEHGHGW